MVVSFRAYRAPTTLAFPSSTASRLSKHESKHEVQPREEDNIPRHCHIGNRLHGMGCAGTLKHPTLNIIRVSRSCNSAVLEPLTPL